MQRGQQCCRDKNNARSTTHILKQTMSPISGPRGGTSPSSTLIFLLILTPFFLASLAHILVDDCSAYAFQPTLLPQAVLDCAKVPGFLDQCRCYLDPRIGRLIFDYMLNDMEVNLAFCYPTFFVSSTADHFPGRQIYLGVILLGMRPWWQFNKTLQIAGGFLGGDPSIGGNAKHNRCNRFFRRTAWVSPIFTGVGLLVVVLFPPTWCPNLHFGGFLVAVSSALAMMVADYRYGNSKFVRVRGRRTIRVMTSLYVGALGAVAGIALSLRGGDRKLAEPWLFLFSVVEYLFVGVTAYYYSFCMTPAGSFAEAERSGVGRGTVGRVGRTIVQAGVEERTRQEIFKEEIDVSKREATKGRQARRKSGGAAKAGGQSSGTTRTKARAKTKRT